MNHPRAPLFYQFPPPPARSEHEEHSYPQYLTYEDFCGARNNQLQHVKAYETWDMFCAANYNLYMQLRLGDQLYQKGLIGRNFSYFFNAGLHVWFYQRDEVFDFRSIRTAIEHTPGIAAALQMVVAVTCRSCFRYHFFEFAPNLFHEPSNYDKYKLCRQPHMKRIPASAPNSDQPPCPPVSPLSLETQMNQITPRASTS